MSDNDAMKKLLYAVLKQKCLKDVDWNKVAADPILTTNGQPDITNGHAARMRYSRFKKQMEGGNAPTKPRARTTPSSSSPKKSRASAGINKKETPNKRLKTEDARKNSGSVMSGKGEKSGAELSEGMGMAALSFASVSASASSFTMNTDAQSVASQSQNISTGGMPDRRPSAQYPQRAEDEIRIKHESRASYPNNNNNQPASYIRANSVLMLPTPNPSTPGYSPSPSPCDAGSQSQDQNQVQHSFQAGMGDLDMLGNFGMGGDAQGENYLSAANYSFGDGSAGYGADLHGEMGEVGEYGSLLGGIGFGMWSPGMEMGGVGEGYGEGGMSGNVGLEARGGDVMVKTEERWDETYRRA